MAAGAAVEPAGAEPELVHHRPPRIEVRRLTTWPCLVISSTPQPFSAMAPVGQACTHLPQLVQVVASPQGRLQLGDEPRLDAAGGDVPDVGALDLGAGPHAARAEHAAVVVEHVAGVRGVDGQPRVVVGVAHVRHPVLLRQRLQLAVPARDAHRADVVALGRRAARARSCGRTASCGEVVVTAMPLLRRASCRRAAGAPRPETSTMHSRHAPTAVRPSM